MILFKPPDLKTMKARLKELDSERKMKNQLDFALWCPLCDYLYYPIAEWPKTCSCCKRRPDHGYHRVNKDGRIIVHFKGQKMLKESFK